MSKWVTFWGNAISVADRRPETYAKNLTLRYPINCPFGGNTLRLHFSNFCGTEPVTLSQVTVAPAISRREINLKDAALVTFAGNESVTVPAGEEIFSDEISFRVKPLGTVSVSIYLKDFTQMRSAVVITGPLSGGFYSVGNQTLTSVLPLNETRTTQTYYFFTSADVFTEDNNRAVICYGDSITSQNWPDELQLLCNADPYNQTAIIRRAASGTRVLREYSCITYESYGLCGKRRFEREISTVSGAVAVIIQQGINDVIHPVGTEVNPFRPMSDLPTAQELENGLKFYLDVAKKHNLKTFVGTLLPIFGWRTYAPFREDLKEEINAWLRGSCGADGLIDFDKALRSEKDARAFKQGFDSGDHLHPSESAYKQMALTAFDKIKLI